MKLVNRKWLVLHHTIDAVKINTSECYFLVLQKLRILNFDEMARTTLDNASAGLF